MYENVYGYISPLLLLSVRHQNVTRLKKKNFLNTTFVFVFTVVDNIYIYY